MKKVSIKNREGLKLVILTEVKPRQKGLAFVMHGQGGFKEQPHIKLMADAFKKVGYSAIRFDTTCSLGESGGKMENVSITQSFADLEEVINWTKKQKFYQEPFALAGHSLGGICVALYAEKYPEKVKLLAPISTVVSGQLSKEAHTKKELKEWKESGRKLEISHSKPGVEKIIKWSEFLDRLRYDLLKKTDNLTMPVLLVAGEKDKSTPVRHQRILYKKLSGSKEFHVIKGSPHTFRKFKHLKEFRRIIDQWLKKYA